MNSIANATLPEYSANKYDINKPISECRRLVEAGTHPQLLAYLTNPRTNVISYGADMELWLPKKKGRLLLICMVLGFT